MYAIIEIGGKQYKVEKDDILNVERQAGVKDEEIKIDKVLLIADNEKFQIGKPYLKDTQVLATIIKQTKGAKVISYKYRRRKSSHWKKGHRQLLTRIKIKVISV